MSPAAGYTNLSTEVCKTIHSPAAWNSRKRPVNRAFC
jgi:hypothetical protein